MSQLRGKCPGAGVTGRRQGRAEGAALLQFPVSLSTFGTPGTHRNLPPGPRRMKGEHRDPATGAVPGTRRVGPVGREMGKAKGGKENCSQSIPLLLEGQGKSRDAVPGARCPAGLTCDARET